MNGTFVVTPTANTNKEHTLPAEQRQVIITQHVNAAKTVVGRQV